MFREGTDEPRFPFPLQILSWLCKKGEDILSKHAQHTATNLALARLHEREFEKFYFTSMVSTPLVTYTRARRLSRRGLMESKGESRRRGIESLSSKRKFHFFRVPFSRPSRFDAKEIPSRGLERKREMVVCNKREIIKDSFVTGEL